MSSVLDFSDEVNLVHVLVLHSSIKSSFFSSISEMEILCSVSCRDSSWTIHRLIRHFESSSISRIETVQF